MSIHLVGLWQKKSNLLDKKFNILYLLVKKKKKKSQITDRYIIYINIQIENSYFKF